MTNREFIESVWEYAAESLALERIWLPCCDENGFDDWSQAAEFTRERLEEIRKVEREIELLTQAFRPWNVVMFYRGADEVRSQVAGYRILSRLESIRDGLKKGMK